MMTPTRADAVCIAGRDTRGLSDGARTKLRREALGFVFQRFNLLPTISVRRNVALPLRIRGEQNGVSAWGGHSARPGGQIVRPTQDDGVDALLARVGLAGCAGKKPGHLSVGQQQRDALARAIVAQPALLLADEPTGNLDSANAEAVLELLAGLHREQGQTIVMITHNEQLAMGHSSGAGGVDRILRMRDGCFVD